MLQIISTNTSRFLPGQGSQRRFGWGRSHRRCQTNPRTSADAHEVLVGLVLGAHGVGADAKATAFMLLGLGIAVVPPRVRVRSANWEQQSLKGSVVGHESLVPSLFKGPNILNSLNFFDGLDIFNLLLLPGRAG